MDDSKIFGRFNYRDNHETEMMAARWNTSKFTWKIPIGEIKVMFPCTRCFSTLALVGS